MVAKINSTNCKMSLGTKKERNFPDSYQKICNSESGTFYKNVIRSNDKREEKRRLNEKGSSLLKFAQLVLTKESDMNWYRKLGSGSIVIFVLAYNIS